MGPLLRARLAALKFMTNPGMGGGTVKNLRRGINEKMHELFQGKTVF